MTNSPGAGIFAAVSSSVLSSIGIVIHGQTVRLLGPLLVCAAASLLGAGLFFAYFAARGQLPSRSLIMRNLPGLAALTMLRSLFGALLFVYALTYTTSIKAMFFTKAEPYFVLFWSWLRGEGSISRAHLLLLALHVAAAITLSTGGSFDFSGAQLGDLLILCSMACSSLSYMKGREVTLKVGAKMTNALTQLFAALILMPVAIIISPREVWSFSAPGWDYLIAQVVMFNLLALTLWYYAIQHVDGWIVSALRAVGPLAAAPVAWLLFGQTLNGVQLLAGAAVLLTSALIAGRHLAGQVKAVS